MKRDFLSLLNDEIIEKIESPEEMILIKGGDIIPFGSNIICVNNIACGTDVNGQCHVNYDCTPCSNPTNCNCKDKECIIRVDRNFIYTQCMKNWVGCA